MKIILESIKNLPEILKWSIGLAVFVILLSIINRPFRIFVDNLTGFNKKIKTLNNGITVEQINKIATLTSAEYHGETYCSDAVKPLTPEEYNNVIEENLKNLYIKIQKGIEIIIDDNEIINPDRNKRKIKNLFEDQYSTLTANDWYDPLINASKYKSERKALYEIYNSFWSEIEIDKYTYKGKNYYVEVEQLKKKYKSFFEKQQDKDIPNLIYIGRGIVSAGIDLNKISFSNEDNQKEIIKIKNAELKIFDSIINPWYIPKKLEGYEVYYNRNNQISFEEAQKVKIECLNNLKKDAIGMGIKLKALYNAERTLSDLASLSTNKEQKVIFAGINPFVLQYEAIIIDDVVDSLDLITLKSFYNEQWKKEQGRYTEEEKKDIEKVYQDSFFLILRKDTNKSKWKESELTKILENKT